jgi:hypothetical protein
LSAHWLIECDRFCPLGWVQSSLYLPTNPNIIFLKNIHWCYHGCKTLNSHRIKMKSITSNQAKKQLDKLIDW